MVMSVIYRCDILQDETACAAMKLVIDHVNGSSLPVDPIDPVEPINPIDSVDVISPEYTVDSLTGRGGRPRFRPY